MLSLFLQRIVLFYYKRLAISSDKCHPTKCNALNLFPHYFLTFLKCDFLPQGRFLHLGQQQQQPKYNAGELYDFSLHNFSNETEPLKNSDDVSIEIKVEGSC